MVELKFCFTEDIIADMLTKALAKKQVDKLCEKAGMSTLNVFKLIILCVRRSVEITPTTV